MTEPGSLECQTSDIEVLKKMEDEHLRLQRQVRLIQTDRQHRTMGVHPQFRRQDQLLRSLKKEYVNLYKDLKIARSGAHKKNDKKMKASLTRTVLIRTQTEEECEERLTLMGQLEELLYRKYKQMLHLKNIVIAKSGQLEVRRSLSENRLTSTENKLEVAMWRFNEVQCENKKIRKEIDHMLNDRALFNQSWNKMLAALNKGKKFLTDLFESSTLAYDQRDEWCAKLKSTQEKGKMDQMVQVQEMRDLQKAYDHEMKLFNFLAKKGVIRVNKKEEHREEYHKIKKEKDIQQKFEAHAKILSDINEYTKEYDIDKIIDRFERTEQENFTMYKLLNEFCAENEVLKRSLEKLKLEVADRKDWNEMMEDNRQKKLQDLRSKSEIQKSATEDKRKQLAEKNQLLDETVEKVKEIFTLLDCSIEPFQHLLGDKQPSLNHVNLTFTLITEKIKEMVYITYYYYVEDLNILLDNHHRVSQHMGLKMNMSNTNTMSNSHVPLPPVIVENSALKIVDDIYLGHTVQLDRSNFEKEERYVQKKADKSSSRLKNYTVRPQPLERWSATPINILVPADPCPSCIEARWLSRISEIPEVPFDKAMTLSAIKELAEEPAFERSDRIHPLTECRVPRSRVILARRYMQY